MNTRSLDLLKLLRKSSGAVAPGLGLMVVTVLTEAPDAVTLKFDGTSLALDVDIFEVPTALGTLRKGAKYFALPMYGVGDSQRWGLIQMLRGA